MPKKFTLYFSYITLFIIMQSSSAMHQLARPALAQASAQIGAISAQLIRKYSQTAVQENNTASADNNSNATAKIEKLNEQNLDKLIQELIKTSENKNLLGERIKKLIEDQQREDFNRLKNSTKDELIENSNNIDLLHKTIKKLVEDQKKEDLCTLIETLIKDYSARREGTINLLTPLFFFSCLFCAEKSFNYMLKKQVA